MHTILLVGADAALLHTRAAVMRKTGSNVLIADGYTALAVQEDRACELVVLCHSLPEAERNEVVETIRARWPRTRVLQVVSLRDWSDRDATDAANAISSSDPARLLGAAKDILRSLASDIPDLAACVPPVR